jgi:hypothetical protein
LTTTRRLGKWTQPGSRAWGLLRRAPNIDPRWILGPPRDGSTSCANATRLCSIKSQARRWTLPSPPGLGLITGIFRLLGYANALGCIPPVLFRTSRFCPQPRSRTATRKSQFKFPRGPRNHNCENGTLALCGHVGPPRSERRPWVSSVSLCSGGPSRVIRSYSLAYLRLQTRGANALCARMGRDGSTDIG